LISIHFTIITDNQTIRYIRTTRSENLKRRQLRWIEYLQTFDFDIRHAPGKNNFLADYLSRIYSNPNLQIEPKDFVKPDIDDSDAEPTIFSAAISTLTPPMSPSPTPSTIRNDSASPTPLTYEEFVENITPPELHPELEQHYNKQDAVIAATDSAKHFLNKPRDIDLIKDIIPQLQAAYAKDEAYKKFIENPELAKGPIFNRDGLLYYRYHNKDKYPFQLIVPEIILKEEEGKEVTLREEILRKIHDEILIHLGPENCYTYARKFFTWKGMEDDFKDYIKTCDFCQRNKPDNHKPYGLLNLLEIPDILWTH